MEKIFKIGMEESKKSIKMNARLIAIYIYIKLLLARPHMARIKDFCVKSWQFINPLVSYVIPTTMFLREQSWPEEKLLNSLAQLSSRLSREVLSPKLSKH